MKRISVILLILSLMSFQSSKIDSTFCKSTLTKKDTIFHSGNVTVTNNETQESTLIKMLSTPFASGLIGILASFVGFLFADYLRRKNKLRDDKIRLLIEFSRVMTINRALSNQARIKEVWINYYNACKRNEIKSIPEAQIMKEFERMDQLTHEILKLTGDLNSLQSEFEFKVTKKQDESFSNLIKAFHSSTLMFKDFDFDSMNIESLIEIKQQLSNKIRTQVEEQNDSQEEAMNNVVNFVKKQIK